MFRVCVWRGTGRSVLIRMANAKAQPQTDQTFEAALDRLEKLVTQMDSPTLPLHELIACYEEGVKLVQVCEGKLKEAEQRIEMITRNAQGEPELTPFDPATKSSESAAPAGPRKDVRLF
jgi:exodeoxyribonuclease VII small subunit